MDVSSVRARARPPIVDGLFYPAEKGPLTDMVEGLLARSPTPLGSAFAIVSPHAGYAYAGEVMASAYRALRLRPVRTAILIGPVHRDPTEGLFLPESRVFSTPLGALPVDTAAVESLLAKDPLFATNDIPHLEEHCLEVQLPFLVHLFPHASIVPILMGSQGAAAVNSLTNALRLTFADSRDYIAVIATANMASYMTGRDVESENGALEELIAGRDWRGILSARDTGKISACGAGAIAAALSLAGEDCRVELLGRASSRGREDEPDRAVHYAAVGVWDGALAH